MREAIVVLGLLLAGCTGEPTGSGDDEAEEQSPSEDAPPAEGGVFRVPDPTEASQSWTAEVTGAATAFLDTSSNKFGASCHKVASPVGILSGTATMTWQAQTPASEELRIVVFDKDQEIASQEGASPLTIEFELAAAAKSVLVDVHFIEPAGGSYEMEVEAEATLTIQGTGELQVEPVGTCR